MLICQSISYSLKNKEIHVVYCFLHEFNMNFNWNLVFAVHVGKYWGLHVGILFCYKNHIWSFKKQNRACAKNFQYQNAHVSQFWYRKKNELVQRNNYIACFFSTEEKNQIFYTNQLIYFNDPSGWQSSSTEKRRNMHTLNTVCNF